jgi:hypothetical protein
MLLVADRISEGTVPVTQLMIRYLDGGEQRGRVSMASFIVLWHMKRQYTVG